MDKSVDKEKSLEAILEKVTSDRRRFVRNMLGLSGYAAPIVRSFVMASAAIVPAAARGGMWT